MQTVPATAAQSFENFIVNVLIGGSCCAAIFAGVAIAVVLMRNRRN